MNTVTVGVGSPTGPVRNPTRLIQTSALASIALFSNFAALFLAFCVSSGTAAVGAAIEPELVSLHERSFLFGREYFVLRSGRAKLIAQADKVDIGPGFMYLVFDAEDNGQTARKRKAFNFAEGKGFAASALEVVLGNFPFTAIGHQTVTRWTEVEGIPAVEAAWWAGGVRVTEQLLAIGNAGLFLRRIQLSSVNLAGPEDIRLRLSLPPGAARPEGAWLTRELNGCTLALGLTSDASTQLVPERGGLEIGPLHLEPGKTLAVDTLLLAQIPAGALGNVPQVRVGVNSAVAARGRALTALDVSEALGAIREFCARTSRVGTTDATVRDVFDKAKFGLAAMVAENGVMDAGIFEYGAQWVRDTSNTLLGSIHAGHFEQARRGFAYVLEHMVSKEGNAMIGGVFDNPDREQFDQMGELMHALKAYRDWTGDDSLLREHRAKLMALIERPLRPEFRDATGMVHNRREFWERTLDDAHELAYQMYVILGLRDAADLAEPLGAADRAGTWRAEADRIRRAMLETPGTALVENGRLIKRRSVSGEPVKTIRFGATAADVPLKTERTNLAEPDATMALPIAFGLLPPESSLARNTLDKLEALRDARWFGGGYERYHSSGQCDQPGPWTFATCFILRAQHEARQFDRSRRTLEWLNTMQGGRTGAWFEEIPLVRSQAPTAGVLPWTSGELSLFVVRHLLGVKFDGNQLAIRPALYPGSPPVDADLRFRSNRLHLRVPGAGPFTSARVNGKEMRLDDGGPLRLPADFSGGKIEFLARGQLSR